MTDKPIMIDDVDVSECPHIEYEHKWWDVAGYERNSENVCALSFDNNADFEEDFLCQDNPNCYYKQLKRLEKLLPDINGKFYKAVDDLKAKEQECEKYKQALEKIREIQKDCEGCEGDCSYCYSGSGWIFKLSDEVLKGNFEVLDE